VADKKKDEKKPKEEEKKTDAPAEGGEGGEGEGAAPAKKKLPVKIIIIAAVAAVLLIGGGVAAMFMTGMIGGKKEAAEHEAGVEGEHAVPASDAKKGAVFYELGEIVVNLQGDSRRQTFLKLVVQLELEDEKDKAVIDAVKPRVIDNFQTYLRELRLDDLRGSAGLYRLREELLFRVSEAAAPAKIKDVLFQQMLVQ
jgi:flagellar FliL protein